MGILDVVTSTALLLMMTMTAGLGFAVDIENLFESGVDDPNYQARAFVLLAIFMFSAGMPTYVTSMQMLATIPKLEGVVPKKFKPLAPDKRNCRLNAIMEDTNDF